MSNNIVVVLSGGMDSVTLAYYLKAQGHDLHCITFDYGQRHKREIDAAKAITSDLGCLHDVIDISSVQPFLGGSALTDDVDVPQGHYAADSMKLTIVPNRNAMMLSIAYAVAVAESAEAVAYAAHAGDHFIYPDCRPDFVTKLEAALQSGNDCAIRIDAPFINMTKGNIAALGIKLGVPFEDTWTCYEGDEYPCGKCGACVERKEAFDLVGVADPHEEKYRVYNK